MSSEEERQYIGYREWSLRQVLSLSVTWPGFFLFAGNLLLSLLCLGFLVYLYFKHPVFIGYRSEWKGYPVYIGVIIALGFLLGSVHYYSPKWADAAMALWISIILLAVFVESRYLKSNKNFKGVFRK